MYDVIDVTSNSLFGEVVHLLFAHLLFLDESEVNVLLSCVRRPFAICGEFLSQVDVKLEVVGIRFNGRE